ncbi:MAG: phosphoenolpyruvate--protein phosphotransferase [Candidatus Omnitrophota bacterium]
MKMLKGIGVSPGVAIGPVIVLHAEDLTVQKRSIDEKNIPNEIALFEDALTKTRAELLGIRKQIAKDIGRDHSDIFTAHLLILEDRTLIEEVIARLKEEKVNVEYVFSSILQKYIIAFSHINDEYLKERTADIKDVGRRVLANLLGKPQEVLSSITEPTTLVSHDFSPSETAMMRKEKVIGFATDVGGPTSHTAIMARSLEIPAVVGLATISKEISKGDTLIIDGNHGIVIINPDEETIQKYHGEEEKFVAYTHELDKLKDVAAITTDNVEITLAANIESPLEIQSVIAHGAQGIGLYRTEYFYMNRTDLPTEDEQYMAYRQVAEEMLPHAVVIRTLDLGGDKFASALDMPQEMNPSLGWRAIRFCLERVDIFKVQLRAILRASAHGNLKIMYPMITIVTELRRANALVEEVKAELKRENIPFDEAIKIGAMIETPSAAIISDLLAHEVSFFSIGTNDLIQYALAVDRINEKIAYLYDPASPAILRLIKQVVDNAHAHNISVGMCGEMGAEATLTMLIIGLGVDAISASPFLVPKIKKAILSVSIEKAREIANKCLTFATGSEVRNYLNEQGQLYFPDLL